MVDRSMDDDTWFRKTNRVAEWLEHNEMDGGRKKLITYIIAEGTAHPDMRMAWWQSIISCFYDIPNRPFGGRPPVWGDTIDGIVHYLLTSLRGSLMEAFESNPAIGAMVLPHSKSRIPLYTAETYADTLCKTARLNLMKAYQNHHNKREGQKYYWDGSFSKGLPVVRVGPYP
jgi:hypothetical protein